MELICYFLRKRLKVSEVGAGGRVVLHRTSTTSRPGPLWFGSPGTAHRGSEPSTEVGLETREAAEPGVPAVAQLPHPPPLSSLGSSGKLFIKTPPALSFICGE